MDAPHRQVDSIAAGYGHGKDAEEDRGFVDDDNLAE